MTQKISAYMYIHARYIDISVLSAPTRVTRAASPPPLCRRRCHTSLVDHFMYHCPVPPVNSPPFGFVGKRNRTCPSAHVRTSGCVSRLSTFDGTKDERRQKGRAMRGATGSKGEGERTRVTCAEDLLRFTRGSRQKRLPPLPPLWPLRSPPRFLLPRPPLLFSFYSCCTTTGYSTFIQTPV